MKVGDSVGHFRIIARLGRGGQGEVWLGEHAVVGKRVAVKAMSAERAARSHGRERFLVEARAVAGIAHPHVVQLYDFGVSDGGDLYFTMEHLEGRSLAALLAKEGRLAPRRALRIAAQIADALVAAHRRDVIHRDLKPDNVFLVDGGPSFDRVKVLDFGLARRMDSSFTAEGALLGTPEYMAPEQCAGRRDLDGRIDVYALGCVLHELLAGAPPFSGTVEEVLRAQRGKLAPAIPGLAPRVATLLARALAKDREARFATMAAFHAALSDEDGRAEEPAPLAAPPASPRRRIAPPPTVSRRWPILVAALVVAAVASPVGLHVMGSRRDAPAPEVAAPRTLAIRSTPPGAEVVVDGIGYGATPVEVRVEERAASVELTLAGYAPWRGRIDPTRAATVDAVLTRLAPAPPPPRPIPSRRPTAPRLTDEAGLLPLTFDR